MYFVFAGDNYYPSGGMDDLAGTFKSVDEARAYVTELRGEGVVDMDGYRHYYDWAHIATIDETGQLVMI